MKSPYVTDVLLDAFADLTINELVLCVRLELAGDTLSPSQAVRFVEAHRLLHCTPRAWRLQVAASLQRRTGPS